MQIAALRLIKAQVSGSKRGKTHAWELKESKTDEKDTSEQINFKDFKKLRDKMEKGDEKMVEKILLCVYRDHWC